MVDHGGDIYSYEGKQLLDYSVNINPLGIPGSFKDILFSHINDFTRYPDIRYIKLKKHIAKYLNIDKIQNIIVGNGAVEIIHKAVQAFKWNKVIILAPTFSEYKKAVEKKALNILEIPFEGKKSNNDYFLDINLNELLSKVEKDDLVILCNPNNPTGSFINLDRMIYIADSLKEKKAYLIVDEAFIEFTRKYSMCSMVNKLHEYDNLFIVRAATKFYGMPGIRLGYGITFNKQWKDAVNKMLEPWNVNSAAVMAGQVIFEDKEYIRLSRRWIDSEIDNMYKQLKNISNLKVYKSNVNFHLIKLLKNNVDAYELKKQLINRGYLIRTPDGFSNVTNQYFRLAVKDKENNKKLIKILKKEVD